MFSKLRTLFIFITFLLCWNNVTSQVVFQETTRIKREKLYKYLNLLIDTSLAVPLSKGNEDQWMQTFYPLQLLQKRNSFIDGKIAVAVQHIKEHTVEFQLELLELVYANYPHVFENKVKKYIEGVREPEIFASAAEYLLREDHSEINKKWLLQLQHKKKWTSANSPLIAQVQSRLNFRFRSLANPVVFLEKDYLPGQVLVISFQRNNRNYPGLTLVRDTAGNLITDSSNNIFSIPHLARSISGLPYYIRNGNTPQGIFRMNGFDVSRSSFIGPTPNIQMVMPFESSAGLYLGKDPAIDDKKLPIWEYTRLLPLAYANYKPLYEAYYAGLNGRNDIIAHGTTLDPELYAGKSYYPFTPTLGCLCSKEIWDDSGTLVYSDQQKINMAIMKAGGPTGYVIVLDIDDQPKPVTIEEIKKLLQY